MHNAIKYQQLSSGRYIWSTAITINANINENKNEALKSIYSTFHRSINSTFHCPLVSWNAKTFYKLKVLKKCFILANNKIR